MHVGVVHNAAVLLNSSCGATRYTRGNRHNQGHHTESHRAPVSCPPAISIVRARVSAFESHVFFFFFVPRHYSTVLYHVDHIYAESKMYSRKNSHRPYSYYCMTFSINSIRAAAACGLAAPKPPPPKGKKQNKKLRPRRCSSKPRRSWAAAYDSNRGFRLASIIDQATSILGNSSRF